MNNEKKELNAGDLVVVVDPDDCNTYYEAGFVGIYIGDGLVDFNREGNSFVEGDGIWACSTDKLNPYAPIEDLPLWKSNYMYLNDEQQQALRKILHRVQWDEEYAEKINFSTEAEDFWEAFVGLIRTMDIVFGEDVARQCVDGRDGVVSLKHEETVESTRKTALAIQEGGTHYKKCGIQPIKSDGGSSSYYTISLSAKAIERINKSGSIELEDVLRYGFGNDFDFSNAVKSLMRLYGTVNGAGKEGNDVQYELNKIKYSLNKIEDFYG